MRTATTMSQSETHKGMTKADSEAVVINQHTTLIAVLRTLRHEIEDSEPPPSHTELNSPVLSKPKDDEAVVWYRNYNNILNDSTVVVIIATVNPE